MTQKHKSQKPEYEPTPEEIEAAKREIQKEWTPDERRRRCGALHDRHCDPRYMKPTEDE